jgi:hypothetical protein
VPCCRTTLTSDVVVETLLDTASSAGAGAAVSSSKGPRSMGAVLEEARRAREAAAAEVTSSVLNLTQLQRAFGPLRAELVRACNHPTDNLLRQLFDGVRKPGMDALGRNEWNLLIRRLLPTVEADYCSYLLLLVDTDADGRVTYGDWEAAIKYNVVELALERLIHQAQRSTSRPRTTVSVTDVLRRLSIVLDTLQVNPLILTLIHPYTLT